MARLTEHHLMGPYESVFGAKADINAYDASQSAMVLGWQPEQVTGYIKYLPSHSPEDLWS